MQCRTSKGANTIMIWVILACLWVLAATLVAFLPMRHQYIPGGALLLTAPILLVILSRQVSPWLALAGVVAVVSMFRRPLLFHMRRLLGRPQPAPPEPNEPRP